MLEDNEDYELIHKAYPHITSRLKLLWGTKECHDLFQRLFLDTRDGTRQGFPKPSAAALYRIYELHDKDFPQFMEKSNIWTNVS